MFVNRDISNTILSGSQQVQVIAIIGPRQSGKSTIVKKLFKDHIFLDMQDVDLKEFATSDPKGFLNAHKNEHGIIIDEAQYVPELFSQIRVEADKDPKPGYYILSGSQNFLLHEKISESLAGRVYFYVMLPFSIEELKSENIISDNSIDQIYKGFYPKIYQPHINFQEYYENYISTYVERDIRTIRNIDNLLTFQKFIQLCALRIGSTLNFSDLANDAGISVATAKNWLSLLETSFILFLLPSYHDNLGKRITKSPKLYFYDVGLACSILALSKEIIIKQRLLYGSLFENLIISDLIKNLNAQNVRYNISFYRDSNKKEIDLILEFSGKIVPIEIKSSQTMQSDFFDTSVWFNEQIKNDLAPVVIYGGNETQKRTKGHVVSWKNIEQIIDL